MKLRLLLITALLFVALPSLAQDFGSISGTVTAGDNLVAGAVITVFPAGGNNHGGQPITTRTNDEGEYAFERVPAGRGMIQAVIPNTAPQQHGIEVRAGANVVVDFRFDGGGQNEDEAGSVFGLVTGPEGEPVRGAMVTLASMDQHNGHRYGAQADEEGRYRIDEVVAGRYMAIAQGPMGGMAQQEIEVQADQEVEVNFELQGGNGDDEHLFGGLTGNVSDPEGNPIAGADVIVTGMVEGGDPNGHNDRRMIRLMTHTDAEGNFAFDEVPVGVNDLGAGKIGYIPFHGQVEIAENEVTEVEIVLEPFDEEDLVFGSVNGSVTDVDGQAIALAHVILIPHGDPNGGNHHGDGHWREQLVTFTDENGVFEFAEVPVGDYLARAAKRGYEPADEEIAVAEGEATEVNFVLAVHEGEGGGNGGGHHGGENPHEGERVELHGVAIVINGDVADIYLLDTDADGEADYILNFGPPDYEPENGAARPENGDEIDITGAIMGHMEPPMVLVLTINGQIWLDRENGDNGGRHGGGNGWEGGGDLENVEAEGTVSVHAREAWHHRYLLNIDDNVHPEFALFFGEDDYDPGNGAARPEDGDFVNVVGGLFEPREGLAVIVVYQINGQFWREPGDTSELFWEEPDGVEEAIETLPSTPVLVRAFPNPFNPTTTVTFTLSDAMNARVSLIDPAGREVSLLANGTFQAGEHSLILNAVGIRSGTYLLRIETPKGAAVQKVMLLK